MAKRAFCVGINRYPIQGMDLKGCVNDATGWAGLLTGHFDFASTDVRVITDREATKAAVMSGLEDLLAGAKAGDVLVFVNASHGSQIPDTSGDEETYDEVICPYDVRDNPIVDDELRELLGDLPPRVRMTVISDSCHSGTLTRAAVADNLPWMRSPDDRRVRFMHPGLLRGGPVLTDPLGAPPRGRVAATSQAGMKHVLLAACKDSEYAIDAKIDGDYHGAMSHHALKAIRAARYRITYAELADRVTKMLEKGGYWQHPQLEGRGQARSRQVFT